MRSARLAMLLRSFTSLAAAYQPGMLRGTAAAVRTCASVRCASIAMNTVKSPVAAEATPEVEVAPVILPTNEQSEMLLRIRHTSAHVMAMAVQKLFKEAKVTIGPWIQNGFYYDFDSEEQFLDKDLRKIKKEMDKIIQRKYPLVREEISREEAERRIKEINEPYKLELLESIVERDPDAPITIYHIGDPNQDGGAPWWDLCAGPHVEHTGMLPKDAISLESIAGAYWRGDETKPMLQRIYGTAWENKAQLEEYERLQAEAKRRDHRVLGKQLNLFSIQQDAGGGLVFWHPKGARIRRMIEEYWQEEHLRDGYEILYTPHMASLELWKTSGHFDFYKEGMFDQMEVEGASYQLKPMNCPFHVLVFKDQLRSYRDLPVRWAELGTVYRYERSGTLHGLFRVRGFTQDDAHIFCLPEQVGPPLPMAIPAHGLCCPPACPGDPVVCPCSRTLAWTALRRDQGCARPDRVHPHEVWLHRLRGHPRNMRPLLPSTPPIAHLSTLLLHTLHR